MKQKAISFLLVLTLVLTTFIPAFGAEQNSTSILAQNYNVGTRRALSVGHGWYSFTGNVLSPAPEWDAEGVSEMYRKAGVDGSNNKVIYGKDADTKEKLAAEIHEMFKGTTEDDISYFYYSGHGTTVNSKAALSLDKDNVTAAQLRSMFLGVKGKVVIIIDACYSGGFVSPLTLFSNDLESENNEASEATMTGDDFSDAFIADFAQADASKNDHTLYGARRGSDITIPDFYIMTASSEVELSMQTLNYGLFTAMLQMGCGNSYKKNGIESYYNEYQADANRDKVVSWKELYEFISNQMYISNPKVYPTNSDFPFLDYSENLDATGPSFVIEDVRISYDQEGAPAQVKLKSYADQKITIEQCWTYETDAEFTLYSLFKDYQPSSNVFPDGSCTTSIIADETFDVSGPATSYFPVGRCWLRISSDQQNYVLLVPLPRDLYEVNAIALEGDDSFIPGNGQEYKLRVHYSPSESYDDDWEPNLISPSVTFDLSIVNSEGEAIPGLQLASKVVGAYHNNAINSTLDFYNDFHWNGFLLDKNGIATANQVTPGAYQLKVDAHYGPATLTKSKKITIGAVSEPPIITGFTVNTTYASAGSVDFNFGLTQDATLSAIVSYQEFPGGEVVEISRNDFLVEKETTAASIHFTDLWPGSPDNDTTTCGAYSIMLTAENSHGMSAPVFDEFYIMDKDAPILHNQTSRNAVDNIVFEISSEFSADAEPGIADARFEIYLFDTKRELVDMLIVPEGMDADSAELGYAVTPGESYQFEWTETPEKTSYFTIYIRLVKKDQNGNWIFVNQITNPLSLRDKNPSMPTPEAIQVPTITAITYEGEDADPNHCDLMSATSDDLAIVVNSTLLHPTGDYSGFPFSVRLDSAYQKESVLADFRLYDKNNKILFNVKCSLDLNRDNGNEPCIFVKLSIYADSVVDPMGAVPAGIYKMQLSLYGDSNYNDAYVSTREFYIEIPEPTHDL